MARRNTTRRYKGERRDKEGKHEEKRKRKEKKTAALSPHLEARDLRAQGHPNQ
ncbi:hypothetical protein M430DRAFT_51331 [Amorphotheca resinae ATCC 22711]|jgi:hypothetical protein|uniref:Uncharacterized protein n=1 Tax=Amorphotheca resinae ATCC 22711 TaxID=857342 RepID=A0A2T3B0W4_AMORE|nr:hypothetical protein M430DRAFT_35590 [Amorphotheca resinae ATCC 22711]XP_024720521.1 hypothetical protein M430DRAFT_51331 [Amorphotheca resinae ATCC 22711]PSS17012.1 hypothetical protein M430DRAFT_35590 [Amorphotheca resinae ATCC 22711]PSS17013.1 hypothetical protein M430DRAFT_51331 [Amorphotheca resinae ATCC 22711]